MTVSRVVRGYHRRWSMAGPETQTQEKLSTKGTPVSPACFPAPAPATNAPGASAHHELPRGPVNDGETSPAPRSTRLAPGPQQHPRSR